MPDGRIYHTLRGGNWYNGQWGHSRVANRNPAHFRGPDDPNHAWYHIGFRVVLDLNGDTRRSGGDLLYRWGNPAAYRAGNADDQTLFQQHDAQWIEPGSPGEDHILIYNNGIKHGYSTVDEIVPPMDSNGNYILEAGAAFAPNTASWTYRAENPTDFFSAEISGAQRLPNGNTLICEGIHGHFFEVTADGEIVWEYVKPHTQDDM